MQLEGKTALVTGGTKGIGLGIAVAMLDQGMKVMITGRKKSTVTEVVKKLSRKYKDNILGHAGNVTELKDQKAAVSMLKKEWKKLDVLIANAGVGHFHSIEDLTSKQWNEVIDVNLTGVFNSCKASIASLKKTKGYIITIASLAGTNFFARGTAYNASKFGLVGFTQAMMMDLRPYDIKCSTIMPGSVSTYFNDHKPSKKKDAWKIQPEDIGQMVLDLLKMPARTLPSKVEVRPFRPPSSYK